MSLTISIKLVKIGNSIRMTIPQPVLKALNWKEGDTVNVGINENSMQVNKAEES